MIEQRTIAAAVRRVTGIGTSIDDDILAVEEPLEIRIANAHDQPPASRNLTITMRTPGDDVELAAGFLFAEGVVKNPTAIQSIEHCGPAVGELNIRNVLRVTLMSGVTLDPMRTQRNFASTSSCGVCGKSSLEALAAVPECHLSDGFTVSTYVIHHLAGTLREAQSIFERTGGLHAAGLFDAQGRLFDLREDVGRHNAVDKLIGRQFLDGTVPLKERILFLSGRVGYELVQKALAAEIPIVAAVGAPTSLAVRMAEDANLTLLGFVRDGRFNIYAGAQRILNAAAPEAITFVGEANL